MLHSADHVITSPSDAYAIELRALADWLVPQEDYPGGTDLARMKWLARTKIRDTLLDEADRAERGE